MCRSHRWTSINRSSTSRCRRSGAACGARFGTCSPVNVGVQGDCPFDTDGFPAWVVVDETTITWQVTICQTAGGGYLYHGEKHHDASSAITVPATSMGTDTYEAPNRSYSYQVNPDKLQVARLGAAGRGKSSSPASDWPPHPPRKRPTP
jgi:hypothetical protein